MEQKACRWQGCWQLSFLIPLGDPYVASTDSRSVYVPHAERADWLRGRLEEADDEQDLQLRSRRQSIPHVARGSSRRDVGERDRRRVLTEAL